MLKNKNTRAKKAGTVVCPGLLFALPDRRLSLVYKPLKKETDVVTQCFVFR